MRGGQAAVDLHLGELAVELEAGLVTADPGNARSGEERAAAEDRIAVGGEALCSKDLRSGSRDVPNRHLLRSIWSDQSAGHQNSRAPGAPRGLDRRMETHSSSPKFRCAAGASRESSKSPALPVLSGLAP